MTFQDPRSLPASFVGLELTVVACGLLTLWHAARSARASDSYLPFVWICAVCYGVAMELVSYRFFDNYAHGPFTVMFFHHKLPLYITFVYPLLIYTSAAATARLGLGRAAEPFVVAFAILALDSAWDILNEPIGWWSWSPSDPNLRARWLGVPLTNYYWHVAFDGTLVLLARTLHRRLRGARLFSTVPLVALGTIVGGILAFLPYHLLKAAGVADGVVVGALCTACLLVTVRARKGAPRFAAAARPDRLLLGIPLLFDGFLLTVMVANRIGGARAAFASLSAATAIGFHLFAQRWPASRSVRV